MVEVRVEIMARSLQDELQNCYIKFKARTSWKRCCYDFHNNNVTVIVSEEEFDNQKNRTEHLLFVEVWRYDSEDDMDFGTSDSENVNGLENYSLSGLIRHKLDDQLQNQILNPSIQWLEIYDPIQNEGKGKLLFRIWTAVTPTQRVRNSMSGEMLEDPPINLNILKGFANASTMTPTQCSKSNEFCINSSPKSKVSISTEVQTETDEDNFIHLSPKQVNLLDRSRVQLKKLGATVVVHEKRKLNSCELNGTSTDSWVKFCEPPKQKTRGEDLHSIDNVINLVKETMSMSLLSSPMNKKSTRKKSGSTRQVATDGQIASKSGPSGSSQTLIDPKKHSHSHQCSGSGDSASELTKRKCEGNLNSSSVSTSRSSRIAANIYGNLP